MDSVLGQLQYCDGVSYSSEILGRSPKLNGADVNLLVDWVNTLVDGVPRLCILTSDSDYEITRVASTMCLVFESSKYLASSFFCGLNPNRPPALPHQVIPTIVATRSGSCASVFRLYYNVMRPEMRFPLHVKILSSGFCSAFP